MWRLLLVLGFMSVWVLAGCVAQALTSGRIVVRDDTAVASPHFNARDRALIRDYYAARSRGRKTTRSELAKRERLPPGFGRGDAMPAGLAGRVLPAELERRLTPLPDSYTRIIVGTDVLLLNRRTRLVADILRDIAA